MSTSPWLRPYTKLVVASTVFLIFAGAMVTSTGSGLAVPDWPLSYGMLMPPMVGGIFYEHGHRIIASLVGLLTVIQAIWLQRSEPRRYVRILGWVAVAAVIVQGLLGGLTVLFFLPPAISIAHAGLAELFLCMNVAIAFFMSRMFRDLRQNAAGVMPVGSTTLLAAVVYCQVLAGAVMRHLGAGLAIPDFPLSFGRLVPTFASTGIVVNYIHRVGAVAVSVLVLIVVFQVLRTKAAAKLRGLTSFLLLLLSSQIALGAYTVWSGKQPVITSLHVMTGALILASSFLLCLASRVVGAQQTARASSALAREVTA
ncbi:MAG TPA: COX15/CtaA family protein [Thermoanaerobaculia bacterium]|nr:COX15/CtaA family protein [Thermoanaerobaculia bacterium]